MGRYQSLIRRAWLSGEYRAGKAGGEDPVREDGRALRSFIRSKMEWIVEREAPGDAARAGALRLSRGVRFRPEGPGGLLYETRSEKVFRLSATGAALIREIARGAGREEAVARLKSRFLDPDGSIEREAQAFIEDLLSRGLIAS
ncbi:MAG: PqqD family protein [Elusimicrobia bacterium]|nr:PqqD family protein [Elusimicrobiota bacterium]